MAIRKVINGEAINLDNGGGGGSSPSASGVSYDNIDSGLDATNAQDAIDELKDGLDGKQSKLINPLTQNDVINNLTSSSTTKPLSAAQGKELKDMIVVQNDTFTITVAANGTMNGTKSYSKSGYTPIFCVLTSSAWSDNCQALNQSWSKNNGSASVSYIMLSKYPSQMTVSFDVQILWKKN